jgi:hypothetical protein
MKYKDPCTIGCPICRESASQRVIDLLALNATCPACGAGLAEAGLHMRQKLDEWGTYVAALELMWALEEHHGLHFEAEDDTFKTLRGLVSVVEARLSSKGAAALRAADLVRFAVRSVRRRPKFLPVEIPDDNDALDFDAPLIDVFDPDRWDRRIATQSSDATLRPAGSCRGS